MSSFVAWHNLPINFLEADLSSQGQDLESSEVLQSIVRWSFAQILHLWIERNGCGLELEIPVSVVENNEALRRFAEEIGTQVSFEKDTFQQTTFFEMKTPPVGSAQQTSFLSSVPYFPWVSSSLRNKLSDTSLQFNFDLPAENALYFEYGPAWKILYRDLQLVMALCTSAFCTRERLLKKKTRNTVAIKSSKIYPSLNRVEFGWTFLKGRQNQNEISLVNMLLDCLCEFMKPFLERGGFSTRNVAEQDKHKAEIWRDTVRRARALFDVADNDFHKTMTAAGLRDMSEDHFENTQHSAQKTLIALAS